METVYILGIDPSLRNTGYALVSLNCDTWKKEVVTCGVAKTDPKKYKGLDAVKAMLTEIAEMYERLTEKYKIDDVVVEFPQALFNASFATSSLFPVAGIAGGAAAIFGIEKVVLTSPTNWNKKKKKEATQIKVESVLGHIDTWTKYRKISTMAEEHVYDAAGMVLWLIETKYMEDAAD